jgi:hypothetical protein
MNSRPNVWPWSRVQLQAGAANDRPVAAKGSSLDRASFPAAKYAHDD